MRVAYSPVLEDYHRNAMDILQDGHEFEVALEADNSAQQTQNRSGETVDATNIRTENDNATGPSPSTLEKFLTRIKKLIEKIMTMIDKAKVKIMNRLKLMYESDRGFANTLHKRRATIKPMKGFKAITYTYDGNYLQKITNGIAKDALAAIQQLGTAGEATNPRTKEILEADAGHAVSMIFAKYSDENQSAEFDMHVFLQEVTKKFRGEKKEALHTESEISSLMQTAQSVAGLNAECNQMISKCQMALNNLKNLQSKARMSKTTQNLKDIAERVAKAQSIYNGYLSYIRYYFELRLEESLSARVLLRKFYQF
ncbi:MAG: hypothetical protein NC548_06020 [Lachnospiraceae bacterium]|nr:hypothetical protein [Lachnospiraceae bacterium]